MDPGVPVAHFAPDEVIHLRYPNPLDPHYGLSPLQANALAVDANTELQKSRYQTFVAGPRPGVVLQTDQTLADQTGAPLDRAGRIGVNPDLTLPGHPEVFVVGDMISLDNLPGVAQVAIQGAKYAAKEIDGRIRGKAPQEPFHYFDKGSMAIISRFRAVALVGKLRITGVLAWLMWLAVHLVYITGFKNRVTAVLHWFVSFLGRGRSERTSTEQQIFARNALKRLRRGATGTVGWLPDRSSLSPLCW